MGRHTKTTGYTHHHTKYTKHHTYERETTISSQLLLVMAGSVFHFDSHRARFIYIFIYTHTRQKNWKNAYVFWIKIQKNAIDKIKSAQYHAKGYEYHFPIQIVAEAVVIVIICRQNFASTNSVMLWRFYVIMETNKFRVMCVWWLHVMKWGVFIPHCVLLMLFRYPNLLKRQTKRNSTQTKQKLTIVFFMGIRFSLWNSNKLDLSVCMHALFD